ncbi:hypothetical protein Efla_003737 [Eimeria flavescens]
MAANVVLQNGASYVESQGSGGTARPTSHVEFRASTLTVQPLKQPQASTSMQENALVLVEALEDTRAAALLLPLLLLQPAAAAAAAAFTEAFSKSAQYQRQQEQQQGRAAKAIRTAAAPGAAAAAACVCSVSVFFLAFDRLLPNDSQCFHLMCSPMSGSSICRSGCQSRMPEAARGLPAARRQQPAAECSAPAATAEPGSDGCCRTAATFPCKSLRSAGRQQGLRECWLQTPNLAHRPYRDR